jgi:hypothetical protein
MKKALVFVLVIAAAIVLVAPAAAHEHREVADGAYEITFGWRVEPAYTELFNGPEFSIMMLGEAEATTEEAEGEHSDTGMTGDHHSEGAVVEGAEETLQLEVSYGGQTKILPIRAVWGQPGNYTADLIPTQPGDYAFRIFGTIGDVEIDETFDSADGEFSTVEPLDDIRFP